MALCGMCPFTLDDDTGDGSESDPGFLRASSLGCGDGYVQRAVESC